MSGVYFVANTSEDTCCIRASSRCIEDAELISDAIHYSNISVRYVFTDSIDIANYLLTFLANNMNSESFQENWYYMEAIDVGYWVRKLEEHLESHWYVMSDGNIHEFERFSEDPEEGSHSRKRRMLRSSSKC